MRALHKMPHGGEMERLRCGDLPILRSYQAGWPMDMGGLAIVGGGTLFEPDGRFAPPLSNRR